MAETTRSSVAVRSVGAFIEEPGAEARPFGHFLGIVGMTGHVIAEVTVEFLKTVAEHPQQGGRKGLRRRRVLAPEEFVRGMIEREQVNFTRRADRERRRTVRPHDAT